MHNSAIKHSKIVWKNERTELEYIVFLADGADGGGGRAHNCRRRGRSRRSRHLRKRH